MAARWSWMVLVAVAGCASGGARLETAAYVTHPTPQSHLAISQAVSNTFGGIQVTIADDALTGDGVLMIDRARLHDPNGTLVDGRNPGLPERFHLVKSGEDCILVHDRTNRRTRLAGTECAPR